VADTLLSASIDGRQVVITPEGHRWNGLWWDDYGTILALSAWDEEARGWEVMQLMLYDFRGVGAYPIDGRNGFPHGYIIYEYQFGADEGSYWSDLDFGDTIWVTAFDSLSGRIEGRFEATIPGDGDTVELTDGYFNGAVPCAT
jgi:hypothetical protein